MRPRHRWSNCVRAPYATTRRIRKHLQAVIFGPGRVFLTLLSACSCQRRCHVASIAAKSYVAGFDHRCVRVCTTPRSQNSQSTNENAFRLTLETKGAAFRGTTLIGRDSDPLCEPTSGRFSDNGENPFRLLVPSGTFGATAPGRVSGGRVPPRSDRWLSANPECRTAPFHRRQHWLNLCHYGSICPH